MEHIGNMKHLPAALCILALMSGCASRIIQPEAGTGLGEIYVTSEGGSRTVCADIQGLWRVRALEDWISLDVNGRNGSGAFTFTCASNESDFFSSNPTRLGHIIIQSIDEMKADTLYVRQQGLPDGNEYESRVDSPLLEYASVPLTRLKVAYANFNGLENFSLLPGWMEREDFDILAAVCPDGTSDFLAAFPSRSQAWETVAFAWKASLAEADNFRVTEDGSSLGLFCEGTRFVVADFGETAPGSRYSQLESLLDNGYNRVSGDDRWVIGGSFWYCSVMEAGYPSTPAWYPSDPSSADFDADRYAWNNNLTDCVWMVSRDFCGTCTASDGRVWRPDYIYASNRAWNAAVAVDILPAPSSLMNHKPFSLTIKY